MRKKTIWIGLTLCVMLLLRASGLQCIITSGGSMEPTYTTGDLLLFAKPVSELRSGDVVLVRHQNILMVKRICAVAGQMAVAPAVPGEDGSPSPGNQEDPGCTVLSSQDSASSMLLPSWSKIYWSSYHNADRIDLYHYWSGPSDPAVPEGYVFVTGDNLSESFDSRNPEFGLISVSQVLGRLITIH